MQLFCNNQIHLFVVSVNDAVNVAALRNNNVPAVQVWIQDSCSECEVMGGLSDHDGVIGLG